MRFYSTLSCGAAIAHLVMRYVPDETNVYGTLVTGKTDFTYAPPTDLGLIQQHLGSLHLDIQPALQVQVNKNADWIPLYYHPFVAIDNGRIANFSISSSTIAQWGVQ